jgi:hypothetical protein
MNSKKNLILLDLDHTLIYGSYAETETAEFLFSHNKFLKVYKRNLAEELIELCQIKADIIIYTTALRSYARTISVKLKINPVELWSRKNCKMINGKYKKIVTSQWLSHYEKIIIIDDSPNLWLSQDEKIIFLVPEEFRGDVKDCGLKKIINQLIKIPT